MKNNTPAIARPSSANYLGRAPDTGRLGLAIERALFYTLGVPSVSRPLVHHAVWLVTSHPLMRNFTTPNLEADIRSPMETLQFWLRVAPGLSVLSQIARPQMAPDELWLTYGVVRGPLTPTSVLPSSMSLPLSGRLDETLHDAALDLRELLASISGSPSEPVIDLALGLRLESAK